MLSAGGALTAAGAAAAIDTDLKGSVLATLTTSKVSGGNYTQSAEHLGRIASLGVGGSAAGTAAVGVMTSLNSNSVRVASSVDESEITSGGVIDISGHRTALIRQYGGAGAVATQGAAASAAVSINTVSGDTSVQISESRVGTAETDKVSVTAQNDDEVDITTVSAALGWYAGVGATVAVNKLTGAAVVSAQDSNFAATNVTLSAAQNRTVDGEAITAAGSLWAGIGANVVATQIGDGDEDYDDLIGSAPNGAESNPAGTVTDLEKEVSGYTTEGLRGSRAHPRQLLRPTKRSPYRTSTVRRFFSRTSTSVPTQHRCGLRKMRRAPALT